MSTNSDGDRPGGAPPPPTNPPDGPGRAFDDPANLSWCARMVRRSLERQGLNLDDLRVPDLEHARAA